ncbi:MAG: hypothetical protein ACRDJW_03890 [Thermomicrobiales bacterium]
MSNDSWRLAGVLLVVVPTIEFGGYSLLRYIMKRDPGYMENPTRRALFTAGHAHAGVLVLLTLVGRLYVDHTDLSDRAKDLVRFTLPLAPILMPLGFFLSIVSPKASKPNALIGLVYLGALSLAVGTVTLGVGLLRAS